MICQRSVGEKRLLSAARGAPSSFNQPSAAWCDVNHLWTAAGGSEHQSAPLMTAGSQPSIPGAGLEPLINLAIPTGREDEPVLSRAVPWAVRSSDTVARLCLLDYHSRLLPSLPCTWTGIVRVVIDPRKPQIVNRHPFCIGHPTQAAPVQPPAPRCATPLGTCTARRAPDRSRVGAVPAGCRRCSGPPAGRVAHRTLV